MLLGPYWSPLPLRLCHLSRELLEIARRASLQTSLVTIWDTEGSYSPELRSRMSPILKACQSPTGSIRLLIEQGIRVAGVHTAAGAAILTAVNSAYQHHWTREYKRAAHLQLACARPLHSEPFMYGGLRSGILHPLGLPRAFQSPLSGSKSVE